MGPIPYALSVSHFISSVGADAGFASIIGLAILVLLYFAQARECTALREHAYESAQRVQELEGRVAGLARSAAAAPAPYLPPSQHRPAAASPPGAVGSAMPRLDDASTPPGHPLASAPYSDEGSGRPSSPLPPSGAGPNPPAGVGAPPLAAATRLIPTRDVADGRGGGPVTFARAGTAGALEADARGHHGATATATPPPGPSTVAALANGSARGYAPFGSEPGPGAAAMSASAPAKPVARPAASARRGSPYPPSGRQQPQTGGGRRGRFALLLSALMVMAVVAVLLIATSGAGTKHVASPPVRNSNAPLLHRSSAPLDPASVTVAVLNGTLTHGLAGRVAGRLAAAGYKRGMVGNTAEQTRTATVVAYTRGHKRAALAVARSLKLGTGVVALVAPSTQQIACPPPGACAVTVVVTVGSDLAGP